MDERQETERAQQQFPTRHPPGPAKWGKENVVVDVESSRKDRRRAMPFRDARSAISGTLQAWLPQLVDLHFARQGMAEDVVLKMVEDALAKAHHTREGFLAGSAL
jgi:hypothetical protein